MSIDKDRMSDTVRWIAWCCLRAGNDGRRDSGKQWQRTRYLHAVPNDHSNKSLCNRLVGALVTDRIDLPKCKTCLKRAAQ